MTAQHGELVTLVSCAEVSEAYILSARLEAEGVFAIVLDHHFGSLYSNALGGARVQVPSSQIAAARRILAALRRGDYALGDEYEHEG